MIAGSPHPDWLVANSREDDRWAGRSEFDRQQEGLRMTCCVGRGEVNRQQEGWRLTICDKEIFFRAAFEKG